MRDYPQCKTLEGTYYLLPDQLFFEYDEDYDSPYGPTEYPIFEEPPDWAEFKDNLDTDRLSFNGENWVAVTYVAFGSSYQSATERVGAWKVS